MVDKIHPGMGGWFLEACNFRAKVTNSIAKVKILIAKAYNIKIN